MFEPALEVERLNQLLRGDYGGRELRHLLESLSAGKSAVVREMARGVSPESYPRLALFAQAYSSGIDILPELWADINHTD